MQQLYILAFTKGLLACSCFAARPEGLHAYIMGVRRRTRVHTFFCHVVLTDVSHWHHDLTERCITPLAEFVSSITRTTVRRRAVVTSDVAKYHCKNMLRIRV
jgi:hypothetical protein